jgi:hypothetical protein
MLLISAHKDKVKYPFKFEYKNGKYIGLLDNQIGEIAVNTLLATEPNIVKLEKEGKIGILFSDCEEWGLNTDLPKLKKEDIVIVVDVCIGDKYKGYDFSLENISWFEDKDFIESLLWEDFKIYVADYTGNTEDADEAFEWVKKGNKVMSFIIPIESPNEELGWHTEQCEIEIEKLTKCINGLKRLINILS